MPPQIAVAFVCCARLCDLRPHRFDRGLDTTEPVRGDPISWYASRPQRRSVPRTREGVTCRPAAIVQLARVDSQVRNGLAVVKLGQYHRFGGSRVFFVAGIAHNDGMAHRLRISPGPAQTSVLYRSRARRPFGADDLYDLSVASSDANMRNGITGYLTHRDDYFTQYFEGTGDAVLALYDRISADTRHEIDVAVVLEVPERRFPDWSMRLIDPLWHPTANAIDAIDDLLHTSKDSLADAEIVHALVGLVDQVRGNG